MAQARPLPTAALLGLAGAALLHAGAERLALGLPCLLRAAGDLARGNGPTICVTWEGSGGQPEVQCCAGWRHGRPWLGLDVWRSGG